jgi:prepilin-type N-terminal cleavage/methylation domain-containing protein
MIARCTTTRSSAKAKHQGFTLIELLIVVVIIGILAAIAIPKFANTKEKALVAAMKSDLRNVASTQEAYWNQNQTYYAGVIPDVAFKFVPSPGVTITIINSTAAGWSAKATGLPVTATQCFIFYGTTPPVPPATADAAVACN